MWVFCAGCASRAYIAPIPAYHEPGTIDVSSAVPYRTLTRADFKASQPPGDDKGHVVPSHASAALAGSVRMVPEAQWDFWSMATDSGPMIEAKANKLRFQAIMFPDRSWWNEELDSSLTAYVLEHEQIHFAIFELEARRLNAHIDDIVAQVRSVAPTTEEAQRTAETRLNAIRRASDKKLQARQDEYERETQNGKLRHRQKEWGDRIRLELTNTAWTR